MRAITYRIVRIAVLAFKSSTFLIFLMLFISSCKTSSDGTDIAESKFETVKERQLSAYPDPSTTPWFDETQLAEVTRLNTFDLDWTYDPIAAAMSDSLATVGWTFLKDYEGQDGFVYKFNSAIGLDFNSDLTFGEKLQALGGKLDLYEPNGPPREVLYQPLIYLLYEIYKYWEQNNQLPSSVYDLNPDLSNPERMQAWWDILNGSDYILMSVFLERMGKYFHQACGTLIKLSTNFDQDDCRLNIRLVNDPDLREYVVYLRTSDESSFGSDNSQWFMLYYQLYGKSSNKVIREEVFFVSPDMKQMISQGSSAQGATGGGASTQGRGLPGQGKVGLSPFGN